MSEAPEVSPESRAIAIVREFNLPALLAGPAGKAISALIGAAVDVPVAAIENLSTRIRDDSKSRSLITNAIAQQAAQIASQDSELVQRSLYRWLGDNARKQANRERVAELAASEIAQKGEEASENPAAPPPDWMNHFSRLAEDASSEDVQKIWGRVLAGEIQAPGTFSLRTLRFISEMDQKTAALFENYAALVISGNFLPGPHNMQGQPLTDRVSLEDAGLIVGASSGFTRSFTGSESPSFFVEGNCRLAIYFTNEDRKFNVNGVLLTSIATEMLALVKFSNDAAKLENLAAAIDRPGIAKLEFIGPSGTKIIEPT